MRQDNFIICLRFLWFISQIKGPQPLILAASRGVILRCPNEVEYFIDA